MMDQTNSMENMIAVQKSYILICNENIFIADFAKFRYLFWLASVKFELKI
jgi:hypothetical protein